MATPEPSASRVDHGRRAPTNAWSEPNTRGFPTTHPAPKHERAALPHQRLPQKRTPPINHGVLDQPNGQGSAAAVQRKRATASRLPRLSAATAVRLWAGHMPTTWRGTQTRPETEAACDQPPEQEYEFDTITPKPSALPKSTTDGAHARNPGQTEKSWLPNNAPSTKARARRPSPPDAPTKRTPPIKHGVLDQPNGQVSAAADHIRSCRGHERSECLGAFHSSAVCCKRC